MEISEARETGLFSCRVDFGEFFGGEKSDAWVVLREATAKELASIAVGDTAKQSEAFMGLLPSLIVDSVFTDGEKPASPQEVSELLMSKGTLYAHVMTTWQTSLPLAREKSAK
jgi:hypothetical protein